MTDLNVFTGDLFVKVARRPLDPDEWTTYYNRIVVHLSGSDKEIEKNSQEFYSAVRDLFGYYSRHLSKEKYIVLIQTIHRLFAYIHRFWIPSKQLKPMFELGVEIWNSDIHHEGKIILTVAPPEVNKKTFTLHTVGVLIEMLIAIKPGWYKVNTDLVRDDVYEGCQRFAPDLMKDVDWKDFWTLMEPVICCSDKGAMYINLRKLF
jgi:hypothetical protein